jgi:hypothetical protein
MGLHARISRMAVYESKPVPPILKHGGKQKYDLDVKRIEESMKIMFEKHLS